MLETFSAYALARLASPKLTLFVLAAIAAAVLLSYISQISPTAGLVAPLLLLVVNIGAAIIESPMLSRQIPLLVLHVALVVIVVLVAASRLCYLKGHLELAAGEAFAGTLTDIDAGAWHRSRLDKTAFYNDGFDIQYDAGLQRNKTLNRVRWTDESGHPRNDVIGDARPLVLNGYRFYTSFNKGFAPAFMWRPRAGGQWIRGTVHLPSYPAHEMQQSIEWTPPGSSQKIWSMLHIDEPLLDVTRVSHFVVPQKFRLVVRVGEQRYEMKAGDRIELADGTLVFEELRSWMGYTVFSDWTTPWLLAACLVVPLSLGWHYWRKFFAASEYAGRTP
jgi:cytochrome c biogenesis protein